MTFACPNDFSEFLMIPKENRYPKGAGMASHLYSLKVPICALPSMSPAPAGTCQRKHSFHHSASTLTFRNPADHFVLVLVSASCVTSIPSHHSKTRLCGSVRTKHSLQWPLARKALAKLLSLAELPFFLVRPQVYFGC